MTIPSNEPERQFAYMKLLKDITAKRSAGLGRDLTYHIQTFGCQMNARDSEKLAGILEEIGYKESDTEEADFVIYNTCSVRENANTRVYGRLGHLNAIKKHRKDMLIAICGCMMQEQDEI